MIELREPPRTGFEFGWNLLGIRFRISPSFFVVYGIIVALLCWRQLWNDPKTLAFVVALDLACILIATLFISYVVAIVYRSYGLRSAIAVREFIGGAFPERQPPLMIQRIAAALAFPGGCFLLYALLWYTNDKYHWSRESVITGLMYLILSSLAEFWGVITLFPIIPYAGGIVLLELLTLITPRKALTLALSVSIVLALAYIAYVAAVYFRYIREQQVGGVAIYASEWVAIFFVIKVLDQWRMLQTILASRRGYQEPVDDYGDHAPWER